MMKRILVVVAVIGVLSSAVANAGNTNSVGKGNWLVGAGVDVNRIWGGGISSRTTFNMAAEVGYFVWDWLMPETKFNFSVTEGFDSELFTVGTRAYWNKKTPLLPFARLNLGVGSIKLGERATAFALNPGIGVDYLLTKNVAVGMQVNYTAFIRSSTMHSFDFPISFSIYF